MLWEFQFTLNRQAHLKVNLPAREKQQGHKKKSDKKDKESKRRGSSLENKLIDNSIGIDLNAKDQSEVELLLQNVPITNSSDNKKSLNVQIQDEAQCKFTAQKSTFEGAIAYQLQDRAFSKFAINQGLIAHGVSVDVSEDARGDFKIENANFIKGKETAFHMSGGGNVATTIASSTFKELSGDLLDFRPSTQANWDVRIQDNTFELIPQKALTFESSSNSSSMLTFSGNKVSLKEEGSKKEKLHRGAIEIHTLDDSTIALDIQQDDWCGPKSIIQEGNSECLIYESSGDLEKLKKNWKVSGEIKKYLETKPAIPADNEVSEINPPLNSDALSVDGLPSDSSEIIPPELSEESAEKEPTIPAESKDSE